MASSPRWKVYRNREYVAACKYPEDAAAIIAMSGGAVKLDHSILVFPDDDEHRELAGDSYDEAADVMRQNAAIAQARI